MFSVNVKRVHGHVRRLNVSRLLAATSVLAIGWLIHTGAVAQTILPTGGQVVAGSATITTSNDTTTITQAYTPDASDSANRAIITWDSFSIGKDQTVQFNNGAGATLNRVLTDNLSTIAGTLSATGSVYLINPNGVVIGKSGVVNVGGTFVASTLDTPDAAFMAGGPPDIYRRLQPERGEPGSDRRPGRQCGLDSFQC